MQERCAATADFAEGAAAFRESASRSSAVAEAELGARFASETNIKGVRPLCTGTVSICLLQGVRPPSWVLTRARRGEPQLTVVPDEHGLGVERMPKRSWTPAAISRASAISSAVVAPPRLTSASVCLVEMPTRPSP